MPLSPSTHANPPKTNTILALLAGDAHRPATCPDSYVVRTGLRRLTRFEDHLAEPYVLTVQDLVPGSLEAGGQLLAGEMRDVFVRIGIGQHLAIDPLQHPPEPAAVIGCAQDQDPARPQDTPHLCQNVWHVPDVLNDL